MLDLFQKQRCYPPKITLEFIEDRGASISKVNVELSFSGAVASKSLKDGIRLLPREGEPGESLHNVYSVSSYYKGASLLFIILVQIIGWDGLHFHIAILQVNKCRAKR